jgi:hypothetical protein
MDQVEAYSVADVCEKARLGRSSTIAAIKAGELRAVTDANVILPDSPVPAGTMLDGLLT